MEEKRDRGLSVKSEGLALIKQKMAEKGYTSLRQLAEAASLSDDTVYRLFRGKPKERNTIEVIAKALDLKPTDLVEESEWFPASSTATREKTVAGEINIDWREVCRARLDAQNQRSLTTNPLTRNDGMEFERDEIDVPLGLVEYPERAKLKDIDSTEQGSQLNEPTEEETKITKKYQSDDEFFEQVLKRGHEQGKNKGLRIAIIGEAGAGKSTFQQKIADWVLKETEADVPIWISLGAIGNKSLRRYLIEDWLRDAARDTEAAPEEWKASLKQQLKSGRVWLLLDGADEMAVDRPLECIAEQLKEGWIQNVQVVLTCRLNVWDARKNALEGFEHNIYRCLNFSYGDANTPNQVEQFIRNWFKCNLDLGNQLGEVLEQPQKKRIKDLVKNPLRLALLCYYWQFGGGELPDTKAELYRQFVETLYEWKGENITIPEKQHLLKQALGKLALEALKRKTSRFRLRESFVREVLEQLNPELFKLALDLNLLIPVGVTAEKPHEAAYAFFHPAFQEYFATFDVSDGEVFLHHIPDHPRQGTYRIFEQQWKEVILLWLGRKDVPAQKKDSFIKALIEFEPRCSKCYKQQAIFLATACVAEFNDCTFVVKVLAAAITLAFGYHYTDTKQWIRFPLAHEQAKAALLETDYDWAVDLLLNSLQTIDNDEVRLEIALFLWKNFIPSREIIEFVIFIMCGNTGGQLMYQVNDEYKQKLKDDFIKTARGDSIAISTLVQIIRDSRSKEKDWIAIHWLGKIGTEESEAMDALNKLISITQDKEIHKKATASIREITHRKGYNYLPYPYSLYSLFKTIPKIENPEPEEVAELIHLLHTEQNEDSRCKVIMKLAYAKGNFDATKALNDMLHPSQSEQIRYHAASSLRALEPGNSLVKSTFKELVHETHNTTTLNKIIDRIYFIENCKELLIFAITKLIQLSNSGDEISRPIIELLFERKIGTGHPDLIDVLTGKLRSNQDEEMRGLLAFGLGAVNPGNPEACKAIIDILLTTHDEKLIDNLILDARELCQENEEQMECLVERLHETQNEVTRWKLAAVLISYQPSRLEAVTILTEVLNNTQNQNIRMAIVENLPKYGEDEWIDALIYLLRYSQDSSICEWAARELKGILPVVKLPKVVTALKNYNQDHAHRNQQDCRLFCEEILQYCAENMSYPDFHQAWHHGQAAIASKTPDNSPIGESSIAQALESQFTDIAYQLQPTAKTYPIFINAQSLEGETDTGAIAQEICNQIYLTAFSNEPEIPEVKNAPQLKRLIPSIKRQLQTQNIALILDKCEPNQEQVAFCRKLSDVLHIAWITNKPVEPPLKGFLPDQPNLLSAIESWLNEV